MELNLLFSHFSIVFLHIGNFDVFLSKYKIIFTISRKKNKLKICKNVTANQQN